MPAKKTTAATKRAAEEAKAPAPKKAKVDPMVAGILETVGMAEDLSGECRAMLASMVPGAFGAVREERDRFQVRAVAMIGEVVESLRARMRRTIEAEEAKVLAIRGSKAGLEGQLGEARGAVASAAAALEARNAALASVSTAVLEKKTALAAAVEAQQSGDAPFAPMQAEKAQFEAVIADDFQAVLEGASQTKRQSDGVVALVKRVAGVDESLLRAMPSTCIKKADDRSQFDTVVLETIAKNLADHVASLTATLDGGKAGVAERAAAVGAAQAALEATKARQQATATDVSSAQAAHREAQAHSAAAEAALRDFEPTLEAAERAAGEEKAARDNFETWNVSCFEMLRDKQRKVEPVADAAPAAEASSPAGDIKAPAVAAVSSLEMPN